MLINLQGYGHIQEGKNNQDFGFEEENMILIVDGCSECDYSESGGRMFAQLFRSLPDHDKPEKFEKNIKLTFDRIITWLKNWFPKEEDLENYIQDNFLFTILGLFETKDSYEVRMYGDGYIFGINKNNLISYMRLNYGKRPPYYAYKYCSKEIQEIFQNYKMRSFSFPKTMFNNIGIATDGLQPIAKGVLSQIDKYIIDNDDKDRIRSEIEQDHYLFTDDITLGILNNGGK